MAAPEYSPPKYFQITREIIGRIQRGVLAPGAAIPSENDLIDKHDVSNTTARKALNELEKGGWAVRIKGKGTFVKEFAVVRSINRIFGFTRNMIEAGRVPSTKLLGLKLRKNDRTQIINGRVHTLKGPHYEIERLRLADGIPMMHETRFISQKLCPGIQRRNLEQSLYKIFKKHYDIDLTEINQMLSAVTLGRESFNCFEVDHPIPALRVEGASFCGKNIIVEMEDSVYRGDIYRFAVKAVC